MIIDRTRFSVITPSLNQGQYIEATIKSVLSQNFSNIEHIIIDGGSVDDTLRILKSYPHIYWTSEQDSGQSAALNKGFRLAKGEIIAWINSDDWYENGAFHAVDKFFQDNLNANVVVGDCFLTDAGGTPFQKISNYARGQKQLRQFWINHSIPTQPAIFFRRKLLDDFGYLDEGLHYAMDYDLWLRFSKQHEFYHLNQVVAYYRYHSNAKSNCGEDWSKFVFEWKKVYRRHIQLHTRIFDLISRAWQRLIGGARTNQHG